MFENMPGNPYQMLLQQLQGGYAGGLTPPGGRMVSGAPQLPDNIGQRGAISNIPQLPSAFDSNGQMNGQQGGIFSQLANNPALMASLTGGAPGQGANKPMFAGGPTPNQQSQLWNIPGMQGQQPMPWKFQPPAAQGQGGIIGLLQQVFGGK